MPIDQLANYAEVFGAAAVIVSLLYVAVQIRANTREQRHRSTLERATYSLQVHEQILSNPDVRRVLLLADGGFHSLDHDSKLVYGSYARSVLQFLAVLMAQNQSTHVDAETRAAYDRTLAQRLGNRAFIEWWEEQKIFYAPDVRRNVIAAIERAAAEDLPPFVPSVEDGGNAHDA